MRKLSYESFILLNFFHNRTLAVLCIELMNGKTWPHYFVYNQHTPHIELNKNKTSTRGSQILLI